MVFFYVQYDDRTGYLSRKQVLCEIVLYILPRIAQFKKFLFLSLCLYATRYFISYLFFILIAIIFVSQTGRPPTYEEYYAMMSRSHTPPPPWSDSTTTTTSSSNPTSSIQARRELLASQPEFREYLTQLALSERGLQYQYQQQRQQSRDAISIPREQQVRVQQQRARAMPPRWVVKETGVVRVASRISQPRSLAE